MHPSGSVRSQRSASSASQRPPSSASLRPPSSTSIRPSSSASLRPPSSASHRPLSSASTRTISRLSRRPVSRQTPRILPLCQALVTNITGITVENDEENFKTACDFVSKNVEFAPKNGPSLDMATVEKQLHGHAQKARINSNDELGDAIDISCKQLKEQTTRLEVERDVDQEIKLSHLPDHLQLLTLLSLPPTQSTLQFAETYISRISNPSKPPPALTWADILAEEPFEGQHWEGVYGLPPGSTRENWETRSGGSTPSLSPLEDDDSDLDDSLSSLESEEPLDIKVAEPLPGSRVYERKTKEAKDVYSHRKEFEDLKARQYWREEWRIDTPLNRPFDLGDVSTLGPSLHRVLGEQTLAIDGPERRRYINEQDAFREILMALQGRSNLLLKQLPDEFDVSSTAPLLVHFTLASQASLLSSFASTATTLVRLRAFASAVFTKASQTRPQIHSYHNIRTLEAFADAVNSEVHSLDKWCASREEVFCLAQAGAGPPLIVSLLSLEKDIRDTFGGAFMALLEVVQDIAKWTCRSSGPKFWRFPTTSTRVSPAGIATFILDAVLNAVQEYLTMNDRITSDALMRVFMRTAEPVWAMVGRWLQTGMPIRSTAPGVITNSILDEEFFIEDNGLVLVDPDFWAEGYALRESAVLGEATENSKSIPGFLVHVAELLLGSGKSLGLLRAMGISPLSDESAHVSWRSFKSLFGSGKPSTDSQYSQLGSIPIETLSRLVYDQLHTQCETTSMQLTQVLVDDCGLWRHLSAIDDLYLMRRGDAMSHFSDVLFSKMDSGLPWGDFHFLNSAFSDVVDAGASEWIEISLVRLSYRGTKDKDRTINYTVKAMDGLLVEYAVPFPLTYIFNPQTLQTYRSVFVHLLQIRRAKNVLERILVRGAVAGDMKAFYAMRSKISWFINALLNFLTTHVIHSLVSTFQDDLRKAKSLDEMIRLHDEHLGKIEARCLLQSNTSSLHRAILSILDMGIHFSNYFISYAGKTTTHDISRQSVSMRRHRSRVQRKQRRNVIGFSQSLQESLASSDDSDSDHELNAIQETEPSFSLAASVISSTNEGYLSQLDKMTIELDGLIRFIRRGVESLAGGSSDAASAFGIFAFSLEDWDT